MMTAFMQELRLLSVEKSLLVLVGKKMNNNPCSVSYLALVAPTTHLRSDPIIPAQVTNTATDAQPSNPSSAFASTKLKPALGPTFSFLTDVTLWISKAQDVLDNQTTGPANTFIAEVIRSRVTVRIFIIIRISVWLLHF